MTHWDLAVDATALSGTEVYWRLNDMRFDRRT